MSKKLAIQGHPTRGNEVIELLEMMGGKISYECTYESGFDTDYFFFICEEEKNSIDGISYKDKELLSNYICFTLEEFLEKYPYKIGDKIPDVWGDSLTVKSMSWDENYKTVMYGFKETIFVARGDEMYLTNVVNNAGLKIEKNMNTNIEFDLTKYSYEIKEGKLVVSEKTPKYPTTFEECLNLLYCKSILRTIIGHKAELLLNLEKLLICRDAYWKIAGDEMGLGKPWEPNWKNGEQKKYCIYYGAGIIQEGVWSNYNSILAFPTIEMRDAFHENFKELIESCKELL